MGDIYISSLAFNSQSIEEVIQVALERRWAVEFTSSFPFREDLADVYTQASIKRMVHNYFPPPAVPFVLNLASGNEVIRTKSIQHCVQALKLCKATKAPFYAAHAGFCIDPDVNELGREIVTNVSIDRCASIETFVESLEIILTTASKLAIPFLMENNVLISKNLTSEGINPLLCCDADEIIQLIKKVASPFFGFLLDTAHLKVSCATLGLDMDKQVLALEGFVRAIHHSDNDGQIDSNQPFGEDYWFFKHFQKFKNLIHVIESKNLGLRSIVDQINLLQHNGTK
jgi:sugar phosphate isomerase/epimerase